MDAEEFAGKVVEVSEALHAAVVRIRIAAEQLHDLGAQTLRDVWMLDEHVCGPYKRAGGGLMS